MSFVLFLAPPKVQVYSRNPGEYGKKNTLICYVSGFHPPDITIKLLKNGEEIPGSQQTDLAFEQGWQFHLTKYVEFTPQVGEKYTCSVRHMTDPEKPFTWGENKSEVFILWVPLMFIFIVDEFQKVVDKGQMLVNLGAVWVFLAFIDIVEFNFSLSC